MTTLLQLSAFAGQARQAAAFKLLMTPLVRYEFGEETGDPRLRHLAFILVPVRLTADRLEFQLQLLAVGDDQRFRASAWLPLTLGIDTDTPKPSEILRSFGGTAALELVTAIPHGPAMGSVVGRLPFVTQSSAELTSRSLLHWPERLAAAVEAAISDRSGVGFDPFQGPSEVRQIFVAARRNAARAIRANAAAINSSLNAEATRIMRRSFLQWDWDTYEKLLSFDKPKCARGRRDACDAYPLLANDLLQPESMSVIDSGSSLNDYARARTGLSHQQLRALHGQTLQRFSRDSHFRVAPQFAIAWARHLPHHAFPTTQKQWDWVSRNAYRQITGTSTLFQVASLQKNPTHIQRNRKRSYDLRGISAETEWFDLADFISAGLACLRPLATKSDQLLEGAIWVLFRVLYGRTPEQLARASKVLHKLRAVEAASVALAEQENRVFLQWLPSGSARIGRVTFQEVVDYARLFQEGQMMEHCVFDRARLIATGRYAVFHLELEGEPGQPATLGVDIGDGDRPAFTLSEVQGQRNAEVSSDVEEACLRLCARLNKGRLSAHLIDEWQSSRLREVMETLAWDDRAVAVATSKFFNERIQRSLRGNSLGESVQLIANGISRGSVVAPAPDLREQLRSALMDLRA